VAVEGASASGKTTAVETAARGAGWTFLPEAYRRIVPSPSLEFHSPAELVDLELRLLQEDARRYTEARARAETGATVLADTGFLGTLTYTWALLAAGAAPRSALSSVVKRARSLHALRQLDLADGYVYLDTPAPVRASRARADPTGHPVELATRHARIGDLERGFYRDRFAPLLGHRFRSVSGSGPVRVVARRVRDATRSTAEEPFRLGTMASVLELFDASADASRSSRGNR
jgi:hypothetical protein